MQLASVALFLAALVPIQGLLPILDDLGVWEGIQADDELMKEGAFVESTPVPTSTESSTMTLTTASSTGSGGNGSTPTAPTNTIIPTTMVTTIIDPDVGGPATETATDQAGNVVEVEYETETLTILRTVSDAVVATKSVRRVPRRTITRTRTTTSTAAEPTGYPPVMPSPLTRIPRAICRRFPLVCVNAGLPTQPPRFLDDNWNARDDEF